MDTDSSPDETVLSGVGQPQVCGYADQDVQQIQVESASSANNSANLLLHCFNQSIEAQSSC